MILRCGKDHCCGRPGFLWTSPGMPRRDASGDSAMESWGRSSAASSPERRARCSIPSALATLGFALLLHTVVALRLAHPTRRPSRHPEGIQCAGHRLDCNAIQGRGSRRIGTAAGPAVAVDDPYVPGGGRLAPHGEFVLELRAAFLGPSRSTPLRHDARPAAPIDRRLAARRATSCLGVPSFVAIPVFIKQSFAMDSGFGHRCSRLESAVLGEGDVAHGIHSDPCVDSRCSWLAGDEPESQISTFPGGAVAHRRIYARWSRCRQPDSSPAGFAAAGSGSNQVRSAVRRRATDCPRQATAFGAAVRRGANCDPTAVVESVSPQPFGVAVVPPQDPRLAQFGLGRPAELITGSTIPPGTASTMSVIGWPAALVFLDWPSDEPGETGPRSRRVRSGKWRRGSVAKSSRAALWQRRVARGDIGASIALRVGASTGPRAGARGRLTQVRQAAACRRASMGPRAEARGRSPPA